METNKIMRVTVKTEPSLEFGVPEELFKGQYHYKMTSQYDIHPDGEKFLMIKNEEESKTNQIHILVNFFEELERLSQAKNK